MHSRLRKNFFKKGLSFGSWITFTSTASAEIMAKLGFNWLAIDLEHSPISIERTQELIQVIELSGCIPLVRLSSNDPVQIKRVMDAGAHGIIVPAVRIVGDVRQAVEATRYPPEGSRGVGLSRAQGYGASFSEYRNWINKNVIIIALIENQEAVENISDILEVKELTGIIIGPYDLSGSYAVAGELKDPKVIKAEKKILEAAKKKNVAVGIHIVFPDVKELKARIKQGYRILAFGVDMTFLFQECRLAMAAFRRITAERKGRFR